MPRALLLATLVIAACAGPGGRWPSLGKRPIETMPFPAEAAAAVPPPVAAPAGGPRDVGDVALRVAAIAREGDDLAGRIADQTAITRAAVAARGRRRDGEAWAKAELETSRLERLGNEAGDLRGRLDGITGDLAAAAASGTDVTLVLKAAGAAIIRATALQAQVTAALAATGG